MTEKQDNHPELELYIDTGNDEANARVQELLDALPLDQTIERTLQEAGIHKPVMLTLLITSDETIKDMNKQYRQMNKPTDVLSFPLLERPLVNAPAEQLWQPQEGAEAAQSTTPFVTPPELMTNLGDVVISWPTVQQQAAEAGHSAGYELLYLLSHGVLHLVGYDDMSEAGYQAMVGIQQAVLQFLGQKA
ncbi:MAG TPA: rRNA maturation RNase YbeY [Ktedonobacteraceae bacterium]|nr:rRNA maturation RNase YbeY [Ktedonobacteraceae bacterium]